MEKLAVHGGPPVRSPEKAWPAWPVWDEHERRELLDVLESGKWWYGERVARFEAGFAAFQRARFCITATSGTTALEAALIALDIGPDDEVIVPPYTFVATASAVLRAGATPVFADIDPETWCIQPQAVAAAVTERTRAVIPVHFGGRMADMNALRKLAEKYDLRIIEDACHAWGSRWDEKTGAGAVGDCGCFSFQMSKNITAGEGGAIVTNDEALAARIRSYTNVGRGADTPWYQHFLAGSNLRLTEFQAAVLLGQLQRLPEQTERRLVNAKVLDAGLAQIPGLYPVGADPERPHRAYHLYCLRIRPEEFGCSRDAFIRAAAAEGIRFSSGYPMPLYRQPVFRERTPPPDYSRVSCPHAEDLCAVSGMWLPHQILLGSKADMEDIVEICAKIQRHAAELAGT